MTNELYGPELARIHHEGFGFHGEATAPGVLAWIESVRGGPVLELGCGSGALTHHLVRAGHRVIATDASLPMVELCAQSSPAPDEVKQLRLPDDPLPSADAIVSVGHVLSYLGDAQQVRDSLVACARALRPGGLLALDLCDLAYGVARRDTPPLGLTRDDWAMVCAYEIPAPDRFLRNITVFTREGEAWRRSREVHVNVLVDTAALPALLAEHGVEAEVVPRFGDERLPEGLVVLRGRKAGG